MNVPKLRFKDDNGQDFSAWKEKSLLDLSSDGFSNGVFNDPNKVGSGYKLINVLDMYIDGFINENNLTLIALSENEFLKNKVAYGDIFFTRSSLVKEGIAHSNIYLRNSDDVTFDGHLIRMQPKKELVNSIFLYYALKTSQVRCQLIIRGKTGTMTTIGQADIATVMIVIPSLHEQTKIANFLTAVDDKIAELTKKVELLQRYKKGVMQHIFSQQLRFKDDNGQDFPEWEEKTLGEIVDVKGGKRLPKGFLLQTENNGKPYITVSDMYNGGVDTKDIKYVPLEIADSIKNYKINTNDIFISVAGTLGIVGVIPEQLNGANLTENANKLTNIKCNQQFLLQYLMSDSLEKLIDSAKTTNAQPKLAIYAIKNFPIFLPSTIQEQTKIANFLSVLDEQINTSQQQLDATKQYKKSLLQQMFI